MTPTPYKRYFTLFVPTLGFLIVFPLLIKLGFWQLHREQEKNDLLQQIAAGQQHTALITSKEALLALPLYATLQIQGVFDNAHPFLLDNKTYQGQVGYHVYSPFYIVPQEIWILVDRGFIPLGSSRNILPSIPPMEGEITLEGRLEKPSSGLQLSQLNMEAQGWPSRIQSVRIPELARALGETLYPSVMVLKAGSPYEFQSNTHEHRLQPERHRAYAMQWFGLAATVFILFVFFNIKRIVRHDTTKT